MKKIKENYNPEEIDAELFARLVAILLEENNNLRRNDEEEEQYEEEEEEEEEGKFESF